MSQLSLRTKFITGSLVLILLIGVALFLFIQVEVHDTLEDELNKRGIAIARHLAEAAVTPVLTENMVGLQLLVNDYLKNEDDIRYIYIVNSRKEVLAHTFGHSFPHDLLKSDDIASGTKTQHLIKMRDSEGLFYDMPAKIHNGELGRVHVGISEASINKNLNNVLGHLLLYVAVIICMGAVVAILFAATITRPIAILAAGVRRVGKGELNGVIEITTNDEIGQLAESFNAMTENLRQTTVTREFMDKLINTMNDALVVISPDGVIKTVNRAFGEMFGYDTALLPGRKVDEFEEQEAPQCMYGAFEHAFQEGMVPNYEALCRSASGDLIPVLFSLAVMYDEQRLPQAVICAAQDISGIKRVQETLEQKQKELEELNHNLEDIVASRTAELGISNEELRAEVAKRRQTAEKLRVARDAAEAANRAKTEFLANMSHEMRTPLNSIIGGTEYLEDAALSSDQALCLNMIRQAGDNLVILVNDLIDLARIEAGHLDLNSQDFNLADTVEKAVQMLRQDAGKKHLDLLLHIDPELPYILAGDQVRLHQVLVNLISNAVKFTNAGKVEISISGGVKDKNTVLVTFTVRDTGIGIDNNKIEMIFESFTQADSSITRQYGGSGLGLAISRRLVEAMGGQLQLESALGVGSSFAFTIPLGLLHKSKLSNDAGKEEKTIAKSGRSTMISDNVTDLPLVLLVDDSVENRELLRLIMLRKPVVVHEAGNGREALDMFEKYNYTLILMDIQMPVMDGYTATRLIRDIEKSTGRPRTPIIALTAHTYEEDIRKCMEAGCDDHIAKPFKKETLFTCLTRYTAREQRHA